VAITDDLEFNMMRPVDQFLDVYCAVPEGVLRLAAGSVKTLYKADVTVRSAHPPATTTRYCFDHDRISNLLRDPDGLLLSFDHTVAAWRDWYPCFPGLFSSRVLVAHNPNCGSWRPNEPNFATAANLREVRILREKTVTRVDRVDVADLGGAYYPIDFQIAFRARRWTNTYRLVGQLDVKRVYVNLRINRHRGNTQFFASSDDPQRDLAAVGNQDFVKHDYFTRNNG
jgi:hypothetical protein